MAALFSPRVARFLLVGATAVGIDAAVYAGLLWGGIDSAPAKAISFASGIVFSYVANWRFTFRSVRVPWQELRYLGIYAVTLGVNVGGNELLLATLPETDYTTASAFVLITVIVAVLNYLAMSTFVFTTRSVGRDSFNDNTDGHSGL